MKFKDIKYFFKENKIQIIVGTALIGGIIYLGSIVSQSVSPVYITHESLTKSYCVNYGESDFKTFQKYFNEVEWTFDSDHPESLLTHSTDTMIHALLISFDGNCMLMKNKRELDKVNDFVEDYISSNYRENVEW